MGSEVIGVAAVLAAGYLTGSVPIGLLVVRLATGKNVLDENSGRTGSTNVMRTAGFWAGLVTGLGDLLKGAVAVGVARAALPAFPWLHAAAAALAVLGHNHSIFLIDRRQGGLRLRGGAGGATAIGCGIALTPTVAWVLPAVPLLLFGLGYASVTTLTVGVLMTILLAVEAWAGRSPWAYAGYGVVAVALLVLALRPNLERLRRGEERLVGWRARARRSAQTARESRLSSRER